MPQIKPRSSLAAALVLLGSLLLAATAFAAAPGGGPLVSFATGILDFLAVTMGPIIFGVGLAIAAYSLVFGSRDGLSRAAFAIIGGAMLFSIGSIVAYVAQIAGQ